MDTIFLNGEQRRSPRFPFHSHAILWIADEELEGELIDLSINGALFAGMRRLCGLADGSCELVILHGLSRGIVRAQGRVVHAQGKMIGVAFRQLDSEALHGLVQIIEMNLATLDLLHREFDALLEHPGSGLIRRV